MEYFADRLNRQTGDLDTVSIGDWLTITEFGASMGAGKLQIRTILHQMDFLHPETTAGSNHTRMRVSAWVVEKGWAKRIERRGRNPFDTIGPAAQEWVRKRWTDAVAALEHQTSEPARRAGGALRAYIEARASTKGAAENFSPEMQAYWLFDHYDALSQGDVASIVGVTQQMVSKFCRERQRRRRNLTTRRAKLLPRTTEAYYLVRLRRHLSDTSHVVDKRSARP